METIAVAHAPLGEGGSERVLLCTLEALQREYDVTLVTDKPPAIAERNAYFGTDVDPDRVTVRLAPRPLARFFETFPHRLWRMKQLAFNRYLRAVESEYDLVVSTMDEYDLTGPSVQYVHYPTFDRAEPDASDRGGLVYRTYLRGCDLVYRIPENPLSDAVAFANSHWTAGVVEDTYGLTPEVCYPPVSVGRAEGVDWDRRENGFVSVGRLSPEKRLLESIDVVAALVDRGHDVHYHLVGPDDNAGYARAVRAKAEALPFVHVDGAVSRDRLFELLTTHRYGLHGMRNEHFGIAIAEMVVAGAVPFVHASGGQREILRGAPDAMYDDGDAVETIERVLTRDALQRRLRDALRESAERFDDERFRDRMRAAVRTALDGRDDDTRG
ncbi:glycosyltransferase [Halorubrum sp. JWXQ-INN 858]|uniref:glycosyltransferase n=1 Tax=Halorubrum sp. JWXQ-INN 858 TaxID=2690782 RepID=UPI00135C8CAB|nr:glycosyltransferase [Halorubrum sp. JWXQ-INN 858]MWV65240.1 glycosyltransferase [Halorubrum sp. JWXQ-INN 858]